MTLAEQWVRRPQNLWLRRALFQIHLWTGIGVGLYVFLISVSGSAIVFRNELYKTLGRKSEPLAISGPRLSEADLKKAAQQTYPGYSVTFVFASKQPNQPTEIWMRRGGTQKQRLFDPYTGKDLGDSVPKSIRFLAWLADLHTNLLYKETGRLWNGIGAAFITLLSLTGAVIWWPGIRTWRRSVTIRPGVGWKRFNWDLHSAVGFWALSFIFMWGFTGVYVCFPTPFQRAIDSFAPLEQYKLVELPPAPPSLERSSDVRFVLVADGDTPPPRRVRPPRHFSTGDKIIRWFTWLHFGNFAGWRVKALWTLLGFVPPFLLVTGVIMWLNRVIIPKLRRAPALERELSEAVPAE
jgi:uncharacterized iron-regulated membrane protein